MSNSKTPGEKTGGRRREIAGIVFICLALLCAVALFSYSPFDPSWGSVSSAEDVRNLIGPFGAYFSDMLFQLMGGAAFILPFYLLVYGINHVTKKETGHRLLKLLGAVVFIVSLATLFRLTGEHLGFGGIQSGGLLGGLIAVSLMRVFGMFGSYLLTITLLLCGLVISTKFSLMSIVMALSAALKVVIDRARTLFIMYTERKRKARAKEERDEAGPEPEPEIVEAAPQQKQAMKVERMQTSLPFKGKDKGYSLPPLDMLSEPRSTGKKLSKDSLLMSSNILEKKLFDFGVEGRVLQVHPGPVITMFEFEPAPGVKVNKIAGLSDDLALAMRAESVRIVAPLPGKAAVGIEIPNNVREEVCLKEILSSEEFSKSRSPLTLALGKDIFGKPVVADLGKMPHLLVAGATGSGKSVALNTMTMSLLMNAKPRDLRLLMVDPKRLELSVYESIPHLLDAVITEPRRASAALKKVVIVMEERYKMLAEKGVRNIDGFNAKIIEARAHPRLGAKEEEGPMPPGEAIVNEDGTLPYIVVVIDELADLMMVAAKEVEDSIARLAQMARASGIHLLIATQRPSVDVITGVIKANFPARMSFQVSSKTDSRTILDANGAEALLGSGDMLFLPGGTSKLTRIHGSYVSETEIKNVVDFLTHQASPSYDLFAKIDPPAYKAKKAVEEATDDDGRDERYHQAVELVTAAGKASASLLQRRMRIGYPTAARIIELMEEDGIVGPKKEGGKEREVLRRE